jgi:hypothetical protein
MLLFYAATQCPSATMIAPFILNPLYLERAGFAAALLGAHVVVTNGNLVFF